MNTIIPLKNTNLSQNIRYLRKRFKWSQNDLSERLNIKRSNIAAYETKNVEPRLRLIMAMARLFDVDIRQFISEELESAKEIKPYASQEYEILETKLNNSSSQLETFRNKSLEIKKILEGFKAFYNIKKRSLEASDSARKVSRDINAFIELIDHILDYNDTIVNNLGSTR